MPEPGRSDRQSGDSRVRQRAFVDFAPNLRADDEEERRHQGFVDEEVPRSNVPEERVGSGPRGVRPQERQRGCRKKDNAACSFNAGRRRLEGFRKRPMLDDELR